MCEGNAAATKGGSAVRSPGETVYFNVGESKGTVNSFLEEQQFNFPVIIDAAGKVTGVYKVSALPTTFIIDPSGNVSRVITGEISEMDLLLRWIHEAK
ncbi:redoxin domain-containing protein [Paenibacillus sp. XY044]|uniref:redoxin domain-containing protein n=1 Tax=Paenibacillus sp. XY044 TaxID=2026089 RepID=UPI000B99A3A0|nr:redoxin domain-containing protein [Paenibacillus sp. XY044]OZB99025.1 hypothetical protein CJP46_07885 [Paenibacillus sp. XY044]